MSIAELRENTPVQIPQGPQKIKGILGLHAQQSVAAPGEMVQAQLIA